MTADYMTKPLTGPMFDLFREAIMNLLKFKSKSQTKTKQSVVQQEYVGSYPNTIIHQSNGLKMKD